MSIYTIIDYPLAIRHGNEKFIFPATKLHLENSFQLAMFDYQRVKHETLLHSPESIPASFPQMMDPPLGLFPNVYR